MTLPVLKYYTESASVLMAQEALNKITKGSDPGLSYTPSAKAMAKMGRDNYRKLQEAGFLLDPDGKYGRLTKARVVVFQERIGLAGTSAIEIDGIIGPDETWPALDTTLREIQIATIEKVLKDRPNLSNAKQLTPEGGGIGHDCGYFAGLAVAKTVKSFGPSSISFTRKDALAARDDFLGDVDAEDLGKERSKGALHEFDVGSYLESLGADRFSHRVMFDSDYANADNTVAYLDTRMNNGNEPVMIGLGNVMIGNPVGHWVAILDKTNLFGMNVYLVYDSAGIWPTAMANSGGITGITTVWADEFVLTDWLKKGSASKIVSRF